MSFNKELFTKLTTAESSEERLAAALDLTHEVKTNGIASLVKSGLVDELKSTLESGTPVAMEGGAFLYKSLSENLKGAALPFLADVLDKFIELAAHKKKEVKESAPVAALPFLADVLDKFIELAAHKKKEVKESAPVAAKAYVGVVQEHGSAFLVEKLLVLAKDSIKWQSKTLALECLSMISEVAPDTVSANMVKIVPVVSELMWDTKKQVKLQATKTMEACCNSIENIDLEPFIPTLILAINQPEEVTECVHALAATTFVQAVDDAALAITVPLLERGFKEKKVATKRKCAVITENMAKLVENPDHVSTFLPVLEPALARAKEEVADPECRSRCASAHEQLVGLSTLIGKNPAEEMDPAAVKKAVLQAIEKGTGASPSADVQVLTDYLCSMCKNMLDSKDFDPEDWQTEVEPVILAYTGFCEKKAVDLTKALENSLEACRDAAHEALIEDDDDDAAELLCDCKFSLAYGSKILLNNAHMRLKRGHRYGIVAQKSAGKTTLLRAISKGQVEGFPAPDVLKTVFVEHDIQGSQVKMNVLDFTLDTLQGENVTREEAHEMLSSVGFTEQMVQMPITALSGGWKMKLGLARAMLRKADILLLDEPTNHLDVLNVQWVVDYLTGEACQNVTSLIVSHDTKFLDNVATNIIHFSNLKLDTYQGNLSKFVEKFPHAKAYYELSASTLKFTFPQPAMLEGVKSKGKAILSMTGVQFTYPGAEKPQLHDVSIRVSMASRVACVGANGAGKSTMIKLLTGELKASSGQVYKHPNCRFAYVAQHAFHHIEQHLDKTPNEYIQWRYADGEDKEALQKSTVKITDEELKKMKEPIVVVYQDEDGKNIKEKRVLERVISRRKAGKVYEYEVKWVNKSQDLNTWYERDTLIDMGFKKLVEEVDRRKAAQEGAYARTLSARNVEQHLSDVGLESELASHTRISSLSGGQKVKVVLAACTWAQPHVIILDEPTNYLDRESLGALAGAINDYEGGVVLITHNKEFADATTRETWVVANNRCDVKGDAEWEKYAQEAIELGLDQTEVFDAAGNKVDVKSKKSPDSLKPREKKKLTKELKIKIKDDLPMTEFEEECCTAWGLWSA